MTAHLTELECLALEDGELEPTTAARVRRHLEACTRCRALEKELARETVVLREGLGPEPAPEDAARREFGAVVAVGLTLSVGVLAIRRLFFTARDLTDAVPMSDPVPLVSWAGRFLISLLDPVALLETITHGGIVLLTLIGIGALSSVVRRSRGALIPALATVTLLQAASPAEALRVIRGSSDAPDCRITADELIRDDVLLLCRYAVVAGTVEGDVIFLAQTLEISGRVTGGLLGAGESVDIPGTVEISARAAAQRMSISGTVGRSLMVLGERITVRPGASIGGAATVFGSEVRIEGPVGGSLRANGSEIHLDAEVGGDVHTSGGGLEIGPRAHARGPVVHTGRGEPDRQAGNLEVEWTQPAEDTDETSEGIGETAQRVAVRWAMGALLGLVLVLLAGGPLARIAATARQPLAPILVGAVLAVAIPILALLTMATVVGIPLGITAFLVWGFALYAARIILGLLLGELILGPGATRLDRFWRVALGLLILGVAVEVPVLGTAVAVLTAMLGLGAFAVWAFRSRRAAAAFATHP